MNWIAEIVNVPVYQSDVGNLAVIEKSEATPFDPQRAYFIYGVPSSTSRGFHAHKTLEQLMIAISGSFAVTVDDGTERRDFVLDNPTTGLLIRPGAWREMHAFAPGTICLVVASNRFDETDYIRNYSEFIAWKETNC